MRTTISKKTRFEVFKRDVFTCQYCGNTPPAIILEIDHLHPVSKGGTNEIDNLITACFDCNRGKSDNTLDVAPETIENKKQILVEKQEQLKEYQKLIKKEQLKLEKDALKICDIFTSWFPEYLISEKFKNTTIKMFLRKLAFHKVEYAMNNACSRFNNTENTISYFCGICWNMIKGNTKYGDL